jgi:hypothetical protein
MPGITRKKQDFIQVAILCTLRLFLKNYTGQALK